MLHRPTVWIYAVHLALPEYRITGIVGPLNGPGWRETDLEAIEYDEASERLQWANKNLRACDLIG